MLFHLKKLNGNMTFGKRGGHETRARKRVL